MKLAFCLFNYFPHGGLQRDFISIAKACLRQGHEVTAITQTWEGSRPENLNVVLLPNKKFTNHGRCKRFSKQLQQYLKKNPHDIVVGFNKLPGLDVYFAADSCYRTRAQDTHHSWYQYSARFRTYSHLEKQVFKSTGAPMILALTQQQCEEYESQYQTAKSRFYLLPPGVKVARVPTTDYPIIREELRNEWVVQPHEWLLLFVGSAFKTKGLERALFAIAHLPDSLRQKINFMVVGDGKINTYAKLAKQLDIHDQVSFFPARDDVWKFMLAADLLIHPAHVECAGKVLLEALVAGLPVLTTDNCGYAQHIANAQAGNVLPSPFSQRAFDLALESMLNKEQLTTWHHHALAYADKEDLYSLCQKTVELIESAGNL